MDFIFGLSVGLVIAIGIAVYFFLRDTSPLSIPVTNPSITNPAVTVWMIESFLNQQLRDALASETTELQNETVQATHARIPFKLKLNDAALDVQPERRAQLTAQLTASAWNFKINLRPVTEFYFVPQDGRVKIIVMRVHVQGFTLPRALMEIFVNEVVIAAEAKLNHSLAQLQRDTNVMLSEIETTEDLLVLKFR